MKKPTYLKLTLPTIVRNGTLNAAVKKYFNSLADKVLEIDYGKRRYRKTFKYKIISAGVFRDYWSASNQYSRIKLELQLIEDPDCR